MAIGFKEKRSLQKIVSEKQKDLMEGGLSFKDKRAAQKAMQDALVKLNAKVEEGKTSPTLEKLIAGEYDNLTPIKFLAMLEKAVKELDGDIEPVKPPAISFIEKNRSDIDTITESAFMEMCHPEPSQTGSAIRMQPLNVSDIEGSKQIIIDIDHGFNEPATFRGIVQALENAKQGDEVMLKINSPGGRTDSAQAVYVALLETKARTKAKLINAASSGSIVAMACDEIQTTPFCTMMIHNASAGTSGKVGDMAAASAHYQNHFREWFQELYDGFLTNDEIIDVTKGQEFYLKEREIKARLENWTPIRSRMNNIAPMEA